MTPKKQRNRTALMYAAHSNSANLVNILLEKGVDINAANEVGLTALMYTDEDDNKLDAMRLLLERGAAIDQTNSMGKTSVMRAVSLDSLKAAEKEFQHKQDDLEKIKPIAIKCISCGAVLHIDSETPRNTTCVHCDTMQYLPDGLWLSLHPVKKAKAWYMHYELR